MRLFLTGGTGLLGNNVIRLALDQGHQIKALSRAKTLPLSLDGLPITIVSGDLDSRHEIDAAMGDCDAIIHSAAHIHIGWKSLQESLDINQRGTQNLVDAALRHGLPMVHVSTVNTLAIGQRQQPGHETSDGDGQVPCTYVTSKRASERVVRDAMEKGLDARIVHPGFMLGPWDWKPSSGRMILEVAKIWTPIAPAGGCSVCDVRDVAAGVLSALRDGTAGKQYILAGHNLTYFELWNRFAKQLGKRGPWTILRYPGQVLTGMWGDALSFMLERESDVNSAAIRMSSQYHWYVSERAERELGYRCRSADESICDAIDWFRRFEYLP